MSQIETEISSAACWLKPAPFEQIVAELTQAFSILGMPANWSHPTLGNTIQGLYTAPLAELPSDLMSEAIRRVMASYVYNDPPRPAVFVKAVEEDLSNRRHIIRRLETAKHFRRMQKDGL